MTFKDLTLQVDEDMALNKNFEKILYEMPVLHNKYLKLYTESKKKYQNLKCEMDELYRIKWHEYKNEGCQGYDISTQKEIIIYVEGDPAILNKRIKLNSAKRTRDYLKRVVTKCNSMSFDIKNIIEHNKWMNGGQA